MAAMDGKQEPIPVDEATIAPELPVKGEVEVPYSIYTNKEKWLIVAMVALAGFYRYALPFRPKTSGITSDIIIALSPRISISQLYRHSPARLASQ
jgi:hypothetical protein